LYSKSGLHLRRLIITAVFLAIYLIIRQFFSFYIPLFGETGMRVGVARIFSLLPTFLFGPIWGAVATGTADVLGHFLRPMGAYLPFMTITAAGRGFFCGMLWLLLRNRDAGKIRIVVLGLAFILAAFGVANGLMLRADGVTPNFYSDMAGVEIDTSGMFFISEWVVIRSQGVSNPAAMLSETITTVTWGLVGVGGFGLVLLAIDSFLSAKLKVDYKEYASIMPLLIAMLVSAWLENSLNTIILRETIVPSWKLLPFVVVWLPRIIVATISAMLHSYFIAFLLGVIKKQKSLAMYLK